jgi:hypothetical protein
MSRTLSRLASAAAQTHLDALLRATRDPRAYRREMTALGDDLGDALLKQMGHVSKGVLFVCTVEDADWLARGIIRRVTTSIPENRIFVACFWNRRERVGDKHPVSVAPIIRRYVERFKPADIDTVVVIKSIISGACVVRTNLLEVLTTVQPNRVFIVAPVMHTDARSKLEGEFPPDIVQRFDYCYFAEDTERDEDSGEIRPGIGGEVYKLLGFPDQDEKNRHRPDLIRERVGA